MFALALLLPVVAAVPTSWLQPADAPAASLFKRGVSNSDPDAPGWADKYPPTLAVPDTSTIPQAWLDKLHSISLPAGCPVSTTTVNGGAYVVNGQPGNGLSDEICSFTYGCHTQSDLWAGPDGVFVLTFDDGPSDASPELYSYLSSNQISNQATHFMIGGNIKDDPHGMLTAFNNGGHIAVHTWSHKYTTALSNEGVVAELGWSMQIIYDLTGGRLPAFWRPPFGDVDNRVRAIAEQVFGLKTVLWNKDTNDWAIGNNPKYTSESVQDTLTGWFTGPKSPGLLCLEHELNKNTIDVFINEHDVIVQNGWQVKSVPDAFNLQWYQNANGNTGDVSPGNIAGGAGAAQTTTTSSPSPSPSQSPSGQPSQTSNSLSTTSSDTRSKSSGSFTPLGTSTSSTSTKPSKTTTSIRESSTLNAAQNNKDSAAGTIAVPAAGVALAAIFALAF